MSNNKNGFSQFILGKGFYFVLALCVAGAGVAGWATINRPITEPPVIPPVDVIDNGVSPWNNGPLENATISQPEVPVTPPPAPDVAVEAPKADVPVIKKETPTYMLPVKGEVIQKFSGETLLKNDTLNDWRTHNGMDIGAAKGTDVSAIGNGKVVSVTNDPLWGYMVIIEHSSDLTSIYCGLSKDIKVTKGAAVKAGQILGKVEYIACESLMPEHLHLEVKKNGKNIDPMSLLS